MSYTAQNIAFFESGEHDAFAQSAAAQQQLAAMGMDGRGAFMFNGMYGVNPMMMETPAAATIAAASSGGAEARRRSPGGRGGSAVDHAVRRATHNAIERARRESLNGQFQDLASAVPGLVHVRRPSKAVIVEKSLEYIRSFQKNLARRDDYIKRLQLRNVALHDEVNRLRSQLGLEPLSDSCEPTAELDEPVASSPPAASQPKRRQQSLDLGRSAAQPARPKLRVRTSVSEDPVARSTASAESAASSQSSPLMRTSPLSAPLLSQPPQLPQYTVQSNDFSVAANVLAGQGQQLQPMSFGPMSAAQLSAIGMSCPLSASGLPVSSMAGLLAAPPASLIDMTKLSEAFATATSIPPASSAMTVPSDISDITQAGAVTPTH
ncbi:hypothetical protein IWW40_005026 [Coemansia sp. RSA 1250]|nr:hypothetical protein IWW40_005026 [Coemansia sp. RSA 1250]